VRTSDPAHRDDVYQSIVERLSDNPHPVIASDPAMAGERGNLDFIREMRDCFVALLLAVTIVGQPLEV
jgi:hypothetical protein